MPKWSQAKVVAKKTWTDGLFTIRVEVDDIEPFLPGQFLQLGVFDRDESSEDPKLINRPYSVASPYGTHLEFFIVLVEEGELTPRLWRLEIGDRVEVSQKAAGSFTLEKTPAAENLWLVATGTGLALTSRCCEPIRRGKNSRTSSSCTASVTKRIWHIRKSLNVSRENFPAGFS